MINKSLAVGIVFLFIVSSVTPMVIGYKFDDYVSSENEEFLKNLAFMCYDERGNNAKYEYYKEQLLIEYPNYDVEVAEAAEPVEPTPVAMSDGPMDSAWSMFGHDVRHTGQSPYSTEDTPGTVKWRFEVEGLIEDTPIIDDDGNIYFGAFVDDYLYCLYPNGSLNWKFKANDFMWGSSPTIDENGTIYFGSWDDYLYAIYPNGTLKWRFLSGGSIASSPAIDEDGTVYFGTMRGFDEGDIFAINPDGTEKWRYNTGYYIASNPAIGDDGTIYIGSGDSYLYAMYPNGTLRWRFHTGDEIHSHPSIAEDGTVYIGSNDDILYAIYPNNGTEKWRFGTRWSLYGNPSIANDGTIYVGTDKLYAINPNGTLRWSFVLGSDEWVAKSSPAISSEGTIYIGTHIGSMSGGDIIAVNPDGTERWRKGIANDWVESSPSIGEDGTVYIGSSWHYAGWPAGILYALGYTELAPDAHGPYIGIINEPIQFTGSADGGYPPYAYHWDFDDEGTSEEQNPTYEYSNAGNYTVTLTVTDDEENTSIDTTWALIYEENNPPNKPSITGETNGQFGESYDYTFISTDPEDQDVFYYIDWGDGTYEEWIGPYESGEEIIRSHTWDDRGTYTIRAKAKDIFEDESDWGTLEVTMPVNQQFSNSLFSRFLERFPLIEKLINRFLYY